MCEKDQAILATLLGVIRKYGKKYCVPSQETIRKLLQEHHKIKMSPRSLCYHLKELEAQGYIRRYRRHRPEPFGKMEFHTTAYYILFKVCNLAKKLGNMVKSLAWASRVQKVAQYLVNHNKIVTNNVDNSSFSVDNSSPPISFNDWAGRRQSTKMSF